MEMEYDSVKKSAVCSLFHIVCTRYAFSVLKLYDCLTHFFEVNLHNCLIYSLFFFWVRFVQAAVSLAVVIPCLLELQEQHYGVKKGIPTLVMAAASFDNVLCISAFGVCLGIAFDSGSALS